MNEDQRGIGTVIYKIVQREAWEAACREGAITGSPDDIRDGFIHLSAAPQVQGTAARHFKGIADLVLVAFDEAAFGDALKWEPSRGGALFPHLYGPLPAALAVWTKPMLLGEDGVPQVPGDLPSC